MSHSKSIALALFGAAVLLGGCVASTGDDPVNETEQAIVSGSVTSTAWSGTTHILTGHDPTGASISLHHVSTTTHAIGNPDFIPTGTCHDIATSWNTGVSNGETWTWFETLIASSARANCRFAFDRADTANTDGSYDLVRMSPTP